MDADLKIEKVERLNLVLRTIRNIGRLLLNETDKEKLINGICHILGEKRGYYNAWIGLFNNDKIIDLIANSKIESQFKSIKNNIKNLQFPRCIEHTLISNTVFSVPNPLKDCNLCALSKNYANRGALAVRLEYKEKNYGFMVVSIPKELALDKIEKNILKEISDDIAAALYRIDLEKKRSLALLNAKKINYLGIESILTNILDITDSKEVEKFLSIQDKMTSLGRVTAGIAHEIRNPLSGIYIYLKALKKICNQNGDITKVASIIDKIEGASYKIESIIKRVMDFSKPGQPQFVMTNLNPYIDEITKLTSVTLRKNGIKFKKYLDPDLPQCFAEPHLIEQVILNLITNAAEAIKGLQDEKLIVLKTYKKNNSIVISVADTGPGIPLSKQSKIFDPFYTTKTNSSGIGLSICHRIILDHGGSLKLETTPKKGAKFIINLPLKNKEG